MVAVKRLVTKVIEDGAKFKLDALINISLVLVPGTVVGDDVL